MEDQAAIYRIVHIETGRCYVGHTTAKAQARWAEHRYRLRRGTHHSPRFQNAWTKYGEEAFRFEVIEMCPHEMKLIREQHFIDTMPSAFNGFRKAATHGAMPEYGVEALRKRMKGNTYGKGRVHSPEERERRAAACRGKKRSDEARANISAALKGKPRPGAVGHTVSPETRAKIKAATDATRPKMTGKRHSEETKARMREKMQAHLAKLKAEGKPWGRQRSIAKLGNA